MDLKPIIVRQYLESLTENEELDVIFPILLESKGFIILSKPKESKGFPQYGKDIVAVGKDTDGIKKRFYFELKGGSDRHITTNTFNKNDGIKESLNEIIDAEFKAASFPKFDELPLKVVLVHNGEVNANVRDTFEGFIKNQFLKRNDVEFDRWGISELTLLFSKHLFGSYLLTDHNTTKLFNRVLVNLNVNDNIQREYFELIDILLFEKEKWSINFENKLPRKWKLIFETLKLISFIIYTESKEYNNLDISKRYLTHLVIRTWYWILKNKLEKNKNVITYYQQIVLFYRKVLFEYFDRTLDIAIIKDGLSSENGGRYEQIGYTHRTFEYLQYFCFLINTDKFLFQEKFKTENAKKILFKLIESNSVSARPLIDIHSIPIIDILNLMIAFDEIDKAKSYLSEVFAYIKLRKEKIYVLPDANNSIENVIRLSATGEKPIYYQDSTSPLLAVLIEYTAILNLEDQYNSIKEFINEHDIDLGVFVPHHGINSNSMHLIENVNDDLDELLFSTSVNDGYQSDLKLKNTYNGLQNDNLDFANFKKKIEARKNEFEFSYRTDQASFPFLRSLAHIHYKTPYFPDKWRVLI